MKLYILASVIIFCIVIHHAIRRNSRISEKQEKAFWDRERQANETRKKPLDDLNYIHIPLDRFPTQLLQENETVRDYINTIRGLAGKEIVNLTGYTNTDLKLQYGTANITALSDYDQRYTLLVSTLQNWADALLEADHINEAVSLMEFAIETETDVSRTYYHLAEYYSTTGEKEKLSGLITTAEKLRSANRGPILRHLKEFE